MRLVIVSVLAGLVLPGFGEDQAPGGPFEQQVAELGHEDFRVRERAHQRLREAGDKARKALEDAAENSEDAEVRERASILLHRMGAGARIAEAITKLDAHEWDEVKAAIAALCDEFGEDTGVEEALQKTSDGQNQAAKMARILRQQWKNWERQQQYYMRSVSVNRAQVLQRFYANPQQRLRQSTEYMCQREFTKLQAKREKEKEEEAQKKK